MVATVTWGGLRESSRACMRRAERDLTFSDVRACWVTTPHVFRSVCTTTRLRCTFPRVGCAPTGRHHRRLGDQTMRLILASCRSRADAGIGTAASPGSPAPCFPIVQPALVGQGERLDSSWQTVFFNDFNFILFLQMKTVPFYESDNPIFLSAKISVSKYLSIPSQSLKRGLDSSKDFLPTS